MRSGQAGAPFLPGSSGLWAVLNPFAKFGEAWGRVGIMAACRTLQTVAFPTFN